MGSKRLVTQWSGRRHWMIEKTKINGLEQKKTLEPSWQRGISNLFSLCEARNKRLRKVFKITLFSFRLRKDWTALGKSLIYSQYEWPVNCHQLFSNCLWFFSLFIREPGSFLWMNKSLQSDSCLPACYSITFGKVLRMQHINNAADTWLQGSTNQLHPLAPYSVNITSIKRNSKPDLLFQSMHTTTWSHL